MKVEPDNWLTGIFNYPTFRVSVPVQTGNESTLAVSTERLIASTQQSAFYYAKVPTKRVDQVLALTAAGFNVVDVNVTFERKPAQQPEWPRGRAIAVRDVRSDEYGAVLDIAASCFVYSRFHLDPQVSDELANAVKRAWINSYCQNQRGERLLVAKLEDKLVGFLAILVTTANGELIRVIDLNGVDKAYQRRGVGQNLVDFFIQDSVGKAAFLRVGTQAANIPSMRLYEKSGFHIVDTKYVLHAHVRNGQVQK